MKLNCIPHLSGKKFGNAFSPIFDKKDAISDSTHAFSKEDPHNIVGLLEAKNTALLVQFESEQTTVLFFYSTEINTPERPNDDCNVSEV